VLLLDASVWVASLDRDDRFYADARRIVTKGTGLAALDLTLYEVANAVMRRLKAATPTSAAVRAVLTACGERLVRVDANAILATVDIAAEHGLSSYDAAYVAAARHYGWTLVSADIRDLVSRELAVAPDHPGIG
jgi:predicted nucleic acid-binding protein